jgi:hypothetical protein
VNRGTHEQNGNGTGYRMTDYKHDEDVREELGITGVNMMIKF